MELIVENLSVARGGLPVLQGVGFVIKPGHALIITGPNGSGKTTLLRTIAGLQPALSGQVTGAEDRIAYSAHADGIKATLTVAENLEFWGSIFGTSSISDALNGFDLQSLADRPAQNLSAGQKRRLGLARLLITGRPLWVLDEPTVSLDSASVQMFGDVLRAHLGRGGLALIASHIDLGLDADSLDISTFRADASHLDDFDEAFL